MGLTWHSRNSSQAGAQVLVNYFEQFSLRSSRQLRSLVWKDVHYDNPLIVQNYNGKKYPPRYFSFSFFFFLFFSIFLFEKSSLFIILGVIVDLVLSLNKISQGCLHSFGCQPSIKHPWIRWIEKSVTAVEEKQDGVPAVYLYEYLN